MIEILEEVHPIFEELKGRNKIRALFCIGINDLLQPTATAENIMKDFTTLYDTLFLLGNVTVKFVGLPYIPAISKFPKDKHAVPKDKTVMIFQLNCHISTLNLRNPPFFPKDTPHMEYVGITDEEIDTAPFDNTHIAEQWETNLSWAACPILKLRLEQWSTVIGFFESEGNAK